MSLKKFIEISGISVSELARQLGYSRQHISNVVNGKPAGTKLAKELIEISNGVLSLSELIYPKQKQ